MTQTMRAAVLEGPQRFSVAEVPVPQPGPGEVLIRLEGCGVCASNVEPWEGQPWSTWPGAAGGMGHEGWGRIAALGEGIVGLTLRQRVTALTERSYAEYDVARADMVVPLPRGLDGMPVPGEPVACAMNIFARSDVRPGQTVVIVGIGFLGAILTRLASDAGARVIAVSRRVETLELARRMGAAETIPMDDHWRIIGDVRRLTDGRMAERVIECVGKQWPLDLAGELVAEGGRLVIAGYHQDGPRQVNMQMWNWKGIDIASAHERDAGVRVAGLRAAVDALSSGKLDLSPLLTGTYALDDLGEALAATRDKPGAFVKAWVAL
ncbi:zinc-binding dehydrogenase [Paracoccus sp. (in: a-proteobacteria)]|uniref:MDR/zinc-dependent alcohol dehydrogenase-like family protein n=1 Tax=Paracoccus sp. TaxID=267 RepID=UPI0026E0686E|nr:zinc-binding dehydrogenase [Paracoccus sp. (in: a-proteobacteria)]MDO5370463.1 zinc-binding dehydrogenase [Paracoccus sp. (in: a-proteobacteria)]